jgi:hypothetical protein
MSLFIKQYGYTSTPRKRVKDSSNKNNTPPRPTRTPPEQDKNSEIQTNDAIIPDPPKNHA